MNSSLLIILMSCFFVVNGKGKTNIYSFKGNITVYSYFFAETFTAADFINSGWLYSGNNIPVSLCVGKSIIG